MKNTIPSRSPFMVLVIIALFASQLLTGCMPSTKLQILQPAEFALPDHIEVIATVNRSVPPKKFGNVVEGVLTGETINQDRFGAKNAIDGLTDALTKTPRFEVKHTDLELKGSGNAKLPTPISWTQIEKLCNKYGADALAVLESYDSDTHSFCNERINKSKNSEGVEVITRSFDACMQSRVHLGWRLYDPKTKMILDEFGVTENREWNKSSNDTEAAAMRLLPTKTNSVNLTSFDAGVQYGMRIAPTWVFANRVFYKKGNDGMKKAFRSAMAQDWKGAAEIWRQMVNNPDRKLAGRATYNMALACEAEGKLTSALDWAQKSYTEFNIKRGRQYADEIRQRIQEVEMVRQQMEGTKVEPRNTGPKTRVIPSGTTTTPSGRTAPSGTTTPSSETTSPSGGGSKKRGQTRPQGTIPPN